MKNKLFIIILTVFVAAGIYAQTPNYKDLIIKGKQLIKEGSNSFSLFKMMQGRSSFERALAVKPDDEWTMYYLAYSDYRICTFVMKKDKDKAGKYADEGIDYLQKVIKKNDKASEAKALLATIYGMKMSFKGANPVILGPQSNILIREAIKEAPDNPRVIMQAGINKMYTPEFFGGSKTKALELFKKAAAIFDTVKPGNSLLPDWGKTESLAWLGIDYENLGKTEEAVKIFKQALSRDSGYAWIKYALLPQAEKKLAKNKNKLNETD